MGRSRRWKPKKLAGKLTAIRTRLGLSQNELITAMGLQRKLRRAEISTFEHGVREPPLPVLLRYAELAGVSTDVLIDDRRELPEP